MTNQVRATNRRCQTRFAVTVWKLWIERAARIAWVRRACEDQGRFVLAGASDTAFLRFRRVQGLYFRTLSLGNDYQIIPMHHFFVRHHSQQLGDLFRPQATDTASIGRRVVGQSTGKLCTVGIDKCDDITFAE